MLSKKFKFEIALGNLTFWFFLHGLNRNEGISSNFANA